jgi:SagB-type dehydrogenase family enzyme
MIRIWIGLYTQNEMTTLPDQDRDTIFAYHQATKHHFNRFADGPGRLDWATQPDPFRRYSGASLIKLAHVLPDDEPPYAAGFQIGHVPPAPADFAGISRLFLDSLALSAWKQYGGERWALRVNPSSGNLHPTEGYLLCGPAPGLTETPIVAHYAPREHALEVRAAFPLAMWQAMTAGLPPATVLVGLTSIHWREAWKYGQRAYRYCQHDVGHALAAISIAAAGLGWQAHLLDGLSTDQVAALLGVAGQSGPEAEHADCLVAIFPHGRDLEGFRNLQGLFHAERWPPGNRRAPPPARLGPPRPVARRPAPCSAHRAGARASPAPPRRC